MLHRLEAPKAVANAVATVNALHMKAARWAELRPSSKLELAMEARISGIDRILPIVVYADSGVEMTGWEEAVRIAGLSEIQLGISQEWLEANRDSPEVIRSLALQKKIALLHSAQKG